MSDRIRLHITPFNSSLYGTILAPRLQPLATNLSFHQVQTDPTHGFGYIELPAKEADALRNKFNGATLRGMKIRIEVAKPEKRKRVASAQDGSAEDHNEDEDEKPKPKKVKKTKRKDGEYAGFELPDGRQVKRGWTEEPSKSTRHADKPTSRETQEEAGKKDAQKKRKQERSKFTAGKEVLFKTTLPEKAVAIAADAAKKERKDKKEKKLRKTKGKQDVVVHEFEKSVQFPSFLRAEKTGNGKVAVEFVEGKGWVDEDGELVEEVKSRGKREDRLAAMSENKVKRLDGGGDDSEDERDQDSAPKAEKKEQKKEKKSKEVYMDDDVQTDVPAADEKTKEELARIDRMLDEESDSEEEFKDAVSDAEVESETVSGAEVDSEADEDVVKSNNAEVTPLKDDTAEDEEMADAEDSNGSEDEVDETLKQSPDLESTSAAKVLSPETSAEVEAEASEQSEDSSSEDDSEAESDPDSDSSGSDATASKATDNTADNQDSATANLQPSAHARANVSTPSPEPTQEQKDIHPLEALYKRPKSTGTPNKPTPIKTAFSFFSHDDAEDDDENRFDIVNTRPQTPFSTYDQRGRRARSAAPTPDTAAIGKRFSFAFGNSNNDDINEEEYEEEEEDAGHGYGVDDNDDDMAAVNEPAYVPQRARKESKKWDDYEYGHEYESSNQNYNNTGIDGTRAGAGAGTHQQIAEMEQDIEGEESVFSKWFWENRGDSNRGWKKRRREVLKVGRQRENRRVGRKVV